PRKEQPPSRGRPVPVAPLVVGGVAVVALGVGAFFAVSGISDRSGLQGSCAPHCAQSDIDSVHTKFLVADVALGVGAAAAVAAVVLYFTSRSPPPPSAAFVF